MSNNKAAELVKHEIKHRPVEFAQSYIVQCLCCNRVIMELDAVASLVCWNKKNLLLLHDHKIPQTLSMKKVYQTPLSGPYALNIFEDLLCKCDETIGLHVVGPYFTCIALYNKFLLDYDKLKVVVVQNSDSLYMALYEYFQQESYFKPFEVTKVYTFKRKPPDLQHDHMEKYEIRKVLKYFSGVLEDLDTRVSDLYKSFSRCELIILKMLNKIQLD